MAPIKNGRVIFANIPTDYPDPTKDVTYDESESIDPETVPLKGGFIIKTLVLSVDPYQRIRMRPADVESFTPPYDLGQVIDNYGVGRVVRSDHPVVKPGDHIYGILPFQHYTILKDLHGFRKLENKEGLPWSAYVGIAGMPGQTVYYAWREYGEDIKGGTIFVTAGGGPVGSAVIQVAKQRGMKVIASAGSQEKINFMKEIGADVAFNYKETKTADVLKKEGPINVYWDNVAGESFDAALEHAARRARFLMCGAISGYNVKPQPVYNIVHIFGKELQLFGILIFSLAPKYEDDFYREWPQKVARGELKYTEDRKYGLEKAGEALFEVQKGLNKGKSVIIVSEE